jgi:hypothetical protein
MAEDTRSLPQARLVKLEGEQACYPEDRGHTAELGIAIPRKKTEIMPSQENTISLSLNITDSRQAEAIPAQVSQHTSESLLTSVQ